MTVCSKVALFKPHIEIRIATHSMHKTAVITSFGFGGTTQFQAIRLSSEVLTYCRHLEIVLENTIDGQDIQPLENKLSVIVIYPQLTIIKHLGTFNRLLGIYRWFMLNDEFLLIPLKA